MAIEDENGFITIDDNPISKSGVFDYLGSQISSSLEPSKIYKVYRPENELNNEETINSFKLVPWIPKHVMLGKDNKSAESVGVQGVTGENVYFKDGTLYAKLKLMGSDLKEKIKNGLKELSCGFRCTWEIASGITPDGLPYDVIQKDIRGNHLASVKEGRMGKDVRVAMDHSILDLNENSIGEKMELQEIFEKLNALTEKVDGIAQDMKDAKDMKEEEAEDKAEDKKEDKAEDKAEDSRLKDALDKFEKLETQVNSISAMDSKAILKELHDRNSLASQVTSLVGEFDYSEMTQNEIAKYTLEKLGVACDSGMEVGMVKGILTTQKPKTLITDHAQDSSIKKEIPELSILGVK